MDVALITHYVWACLLAVGPILGYIPQYFDIKKTRNYQGFSPVICFILLTSNILRILSFILTPFDVFLLAQSIFMVLVQLLVLQIIVKYSAREILPASSPMPSSSDAKKNYFESFWAWNSFLDYLIFLFCFTSFFALIVLFDKFVYSSKFIEITFLYTSTLIESTLCMPQVLTNWRNGSTAGLHKSLVVSWIFGDLFKLCYYLYSKSRMPFVVCAIIQISVDFIIIIQILYYHFNVKISKEEISRASSTVPLKDSK